MANAPSPCIEDYQCPADRKFEAFSVVYEEREFVRKHYLSARRRSIMCTCDECLSVWAMLALGVLTCLGTIGIGLTAVLVDIEQYGWGMYLMLIGITGLMLCTIVCVMGVDREHHRSKRRRQRLQMEDEHATVGDTKSIPKPKIDVILEEPTVVNLHEQVDTQSTSSIPAAQAYKAARASLRRSSNALINWHRERLLGRPARPLPPAEGSRGRQGALEHLVKAVHRSTFDSSSSIETSSSQSSLSTLAQSSGSAHFGHDLIVSKLLVQHPSNYLHPYNAHMPRQMRRQSILTAAAIPPADRPKQKYSLWTVRTSGSNLLHLPKRAQSCGTDPSRLLNLPVIRQSVREERVSSDRSVSDNESIQSNESSIRSIVPLAEESVCASVDGDEVFL